MNRLAAPFASISLLVLLAFSNGCGVNDSMEKMTKNTERMASQIEQDQQLIITTTKHMDRMATQIEQDQQYIKLLAESLSKLEKMGTAMFSLISDNLFAKTPATKSDDIDDVLNGSTPSIPTKETQK